MAKAGKRGTQVGTAASEMMDTREVAAYLRLKQRRIYDLVKRRAIPHVRATGKLLFPRARIDAWLADKGEAPTRAAVRPPIIAGSHDPLLEWSVRESRCGLAMLSIGSRAGVEALARGEATAAAAHWLDPATGEYNVPLVRELLSGAEIVVIEWAQRTQGLLLREGNPQRIRKIADLGKKRLRVAGRQPGAGSHQLFAQLLARAGLRSEDLDWLPRVAHAETELAAMIRDGHADVGFGIEAAARACGLAFIPVASERIDLITSRRDAFEPPLQTLLAWARTPEFEMQATALGGYNVANTGRVVFNA